MALFYVTERNVILKTFEVEADSADEARKAWEEHGAECGKEIDSESYDCSLVEVRDDIGWREA